MRNEGARGLSPEQIRAILCDYLTALPEGIECKIQKYIRLLDVWNRRIALTSMRDPEEIVRFHFGESIFAISLLGNDDGRLADVGSGAGFPGLALKLAKPSLEVVLVESNKKKCAFLEEAIREIGLNGVGVLASRFEDAEISSQSLGFLTSRALGGHSAFLDWAQKRLVSSGSVVLWLGKGVLQSVRGKAGWRWEDPLLIPGSRERFVIKGTPDRG